MEVTEAINSHPVQTPSEPSVCIFDEPSISKLICIVWNFRALYNTYLPFRLETTR
jgi:hypothetical protein